MKYITLFLLLLSLVASANLATLKDGLLLDSNTNKPYTGNIETLNENWGENKIEFSKDYIDGLLHGQERTFYRSGELKSVGYFREGLLNGTVSMYFEDGTLMGRMEMENNLNNGRGIRYYSNGNKQLERFFVNNKLEGLTRGWYESGNIKTEKDYKNGLLHGYLKTYYKDGGIYEEVKYEHGKPKFKRAYLEDGTLIDESMFFDKRLIKLITG
jgi:antitoxin component YwqK of YwqJK toxin-antitoxin module